MQSLDRRNALTTLGLAGAVALVTPAAVIGANAIDAACSSELATLIHRYRAEIDEWEAIPDKTDEFFHAETHFDATMQQMIGVPASTRDDAIAAFQFIRDEFELEDRYGGYLADALTLLLDAVSGYIWASIHVGFDCRLTPRLLTQDNNPARASFHCFLECSHRHVKADTADAVGCTLMQCVAVIPTGGNNITLAWDIRLEKAPRRVVSHRGQPVC